MGGHFDDTDDVRQFVHIIIAIVSSLILILIIGVIIYTCKVRARTKKIRLVRKVIKKSPKEIQMLSFENFEHSQTCTSPD